MFNTSVTVYIKANDVSLTRSLLKAQGKMKRFSKYALNSGKVIARGVGVGMAAASYGALKASKAFLKFEREMAQVSTLTSSTKNQMLGMGREVQNLAIKFAMVDTSAITKGLYDIVSAGVPAKEATAFLAVSMKAAQAGATDTSKAVDTLTSVVNSYGSALGGMTNKTSQAKVASDVLFGTIKYGKITMEDLSSGIGQVTSLAAKMGVRFQEVGAALATMTIQGIPASKSIIYLRSILATLAKPTKGALKVADSLGIGNKFNIQTVKLMGLRNFLGMIEEATKGNSKALRGLFRNIRAFTGVMALSGKQGQKYTAILKGLNESAGATNDAFIKMKNTASFKFTQLAAAAKQMQVSFGRGFIQEIMKINDFNGDKLLDFLRSAEQLGTSVGRAFAFMYKNIQAASLTLGIMKDQTKHAMKTTDVSPGNVISKAFSSKETYTANKEVGYSPSLSRAIRDTFYDMTGIRSKEKSNIAFIKMMSSRAERNKRMQYKASEDEYKANIQSRQKSVADIFNAPALVELKKSNKLLTQIVDESKTKAVIVKETNNRRK